VEPGVMGQKPRAASAPLFDRGFSLRLAWQGLMVGGVTLAAYLLGEYVLSDPSVAAATANTMAFATLTISQLFHAFDVRSEDRSIFSIGLFTNPAMNKAFLVGMALQLAVLLFPPLMEVFRVVPLTGTDWLCVAALSLAPVLICEGEKSIRRALRGQKRGVSRAETEMSRLRRSA
jgi:Ca2+-transporting ATPase